MLLFFLIFKLTVLQADICDVVVDAIVHPTNNTFYLGGEVGSAISAKGGKELRDEVTKLHRNNGNLTVGGGNIKTNKSVFNYQLALFPFCSGC